MRHAHVAPAKNTNTATAKHNSFTLNFCHERLTSISMISFNLKCGNDHEFEGWFASSAEYESQNKSKLVNCPYCGDDNITKALMAPNVASKTNKADSQDKMQVMPSKSEANMYKAMRALQKKVESECDFVGDRFASEARKIHYGETEARGIYGKATNEEAVDLKEEGIEVAALPWLPPEN